MSQFHHHPDGLIYVRTPNGTYADTLANFATDNGAAEPVLPSGVAQRIYDGATHQLFDANNNQVGCGDVPWPFGDGAMAGAATLLAAQATRIAASAPAAPAAPAVAIPKATP